MAKHGIRGFLRQFDSAGPPLAFRRYLWAIPIILLFIGLWDAGLTGLNLVAFGLMLGWQGGVWMAMRGHYLSPDEWHAWEQRRWPPRKDNDHV